MFKHYIIVGFRNLLIYKTQNIISVLGLAIGFTCFALSLIWIQYEHSYDNFHSFSDRIYQVYNTDSNTEQWKGTATPDPLSKFLKENFPEVEEATTVSTGLCNFYTDPMDFQKLEEFKNGVISNIRTPLYGNILYCTPPFFKIFDFPKNISLPEYSPEMKNTGLFPCVITEKLAASLFPDENPIGKILYQTDGNQLQILHTIKEWPKNTNLSFEIILPKKTDTNWGVISPSTYLLLSKKADVDKFREKLASANLRSEYQKNTFLDIILLKDKNVLHPSYNRNINYTAIQLFSISGLLVVFCAIFNYLILYVNRMKMRSRELALRKVNGASERNLFEILAIDFSILILLSIFIGLVILIAVVPLFKEFTKIYISDIQIILRGVLVVIGAVIVLSTLFVFPIIHRVKRKTLQTSISKQGGREIFNFYTFCVFLQMMVAFGMIACTSIFIKQIHFLNHIDLGYTKNIAMFRVEHPSDISTLKNIPLVLDAIPVTHSSILSSSSYRFIEVETGARETSQLPVKATLSSVAPGFFNFFEIPLLKGNMFNSENIVENEYLINETAASALGWKEPIGQTFSYGDNNGIVIGMVKDFYMDGIKKEVEPMFIKQEKNKNFHKVAYKYLPDKKEETEKAVVEAFRNLFKERYPSLDVSSFTLNMNYLEEIYLSRFTNERNLLKLLNITTSVCIIISLFGVYAMIMITCTKRRKEIAIRKIHGASIGTILSGLLKEYILILFLAALLIFPISYFIMKNWLENYIERTPVTLFFYLSLFLVMLFLTLLVVIYQVIKTSKLNPGEVLKGE